MPQRTPTPCPPQPKDWSIKMNKKERRLALATALQSAAPDMLAVDSISSDGKVCAWITGRAAGQLVLFERQLGRHAMPHAMLQAASSEIVCVVSQATRRN